MQRLSSLLLMFVISAAFFTAVQSKLNTVTPPEYLTALLEGYRVPLEDDNIVSSYASKRSPGRVSRFNARADHPLCFFTALPCFSHNKRLIPLNDE